VSLIKKVGILKLVFDENLSGTRRQDANEICSTIIIIITAMPSNHMHHYPFLLHEERVISVNKLVFWEVEFSDVMRALVLLI